MRLRTLRYCAGVLLLGGVYFVTGYLGLMFKPVSDYATLIWPPSGIALAVLVLYGRRFWPGIAAGAFLLNLFVGLNLPQAPPWLVAVGTAAGIATGNTLEAVVGAYLLRRGADFRPALNRLSDVLRLIFLGAALSTVVSATLGVCSIGLGGPLKDGFGRTWLAWWVGDVLGDLVFAPLVLTWASRPFRGIPVRRLTEALMLTWVLLLVGLLVLAKPQLAGVMDPHLKYLMFPVLIWAALRFGPRGAAGMTLAILTLSLWGAMQRLGEFAGTDLSTSLLLLQIYVSAAAVTGLTLAAVVAERRYAERLARESEARLSTMAQVVPAILFTTRPDGSCDYVSRQFYDYTGLSPGSAFGYGWTSALHPDDEEPTRTQWLACVQAGQPFETSYRFRDKHGSYCWYLGRCLPLRDDRGRIVKWFGACIDIDSQKRAEDALRDADRRKDEFLAMLAHELRNPLTPIVNALEIISPRGDDQPQAIVWAKDVMDRQVRHLVRLVDDLLDVSRISRGIITLRKERIDIATIINQALESIRPLVEARGHELTVAVPPEPMYLEADPTRLLQVVVNLLNNAVKYTEPGGHIGLTVERQESDVVLHVKDTGIGIAPDLLPQIFDLFVQSQRALARSQGGLGIGLTLVRRLVEMHGGSVTAHSAGPNRGSEFGVRLPLLKDAGERMKDEKDGGSSCVLPPSSVSLKVLVVDDNEDAADSLALLLRMRGHAVYVVYDGAAALDAARVRWPEVVLLDIGLPILDGYEVAERIRDMDGRPKPVVIALTGYGQEENRRKAREAGFDHYLIKPVDPEEINHLLDTVAHGAKTAAARNATSP